MSDKLFSIEDIQRIIQQVVANIETPAPEVASPLVLLANTNKKGLSARDVAKNIIARQSEAGAPIGPLPDGEESISEKMEFIRVQEIIEHIITNAKIKVVIPPGTPITGTGIGADGVPVQVQGVTTGLAVGSAIIQ